MLMIIYSFFYFFYIQHQQIKNFFGGGAQKVECWGLTGHLLLKVSNLDIKGHISGLQIALFRSVNSQKSAILRNTVTFGKVGILGVILK